ncbi:hypothetical protein [Marispirochaeta aestuarii]|uniref:hypothetical protein n=1 Tax=Marispirochaeta aestuarii TaxID=1963862 RepID=UPI0029C95471|nr:hypothetical protein [Marispirochaeta aestuarii]
MKRNYLVILALITIFALLGGVVTAEDLTIEYQYDITGTARTNYLTFTGPIRYMAVEKDHFDGRTGASVQTSTEKFQPYRYDVKGRNALPDTLRGLFLFAVAESAQPKIDNLTVDKDRSGVITIQYVHRGTAYRLVTDSSGRINLPNGTFQKRSIGFISGHNPQVISSDFSRNGQANGVDWDKVWSTGVAGGKAIPGSDKKTGNIVSDGADPNSMFYWDGSLQVDFRGNELKINGGLNAVKR